MNVNEYNKLRTVKAFAEFKERLALHNAICLEPIWLGAQNPHKIKCEIGHIGYPRPAGLQHGQGPCRQCAQEDRARISTLRAKNAFLERLNAIGAEMIESKWLGNSIPHLIKCNSGHITKKIPANLQQGIITCAACVGREPITRFKQLKNDLSKIGAILLEDKWLGANTPHKAICINGHTCKAYPNHVMAGDGICAACSYTWDIFYIVGDTKGNIKFGITSRDHRPRLRVHARNGFTKIIRLGSNLPNGYALIIEQTAKDALDIAKIQPIRGHEYFPPEALPILINLLESEG